RFGSSTFFTAATRRELHAIPTRRASDLGPRAQAEGDRRRLVGVSAPARLRGLPRDRRFGGGEALRRHGAFRRAGGGGRAPQPGRDRKSTRLNSSHVKNSYAVFCLKKKEA